MIDLNNPTREEFYTSYPFFKYWNKSSNDILLEPKPANIYIHFPFCIQKCEYCYYKTDKYKSQKQVEDYIDALAYEFEITSALFGLKKRPINSIYIGGGTPSLLKPEQLKRIVSALRETHLINTPEFTIECEPGTFNENKLEKYKELGINRISMGVQSFDDEVIKLSSRKHTSEQAIKSIKLVQNIKGFNLNIDLLSGLPGDTLSKFRQSINTALDNGIDMLTIYKLKVYANTFIFNKSVRKSEITLPSEDEETAFFSAGLKSIIERNYNLWTTFAYTKDKYKHTYIEKTWRGEDLFSYGASAFGKVGNILYQNINDTKNYIETLNTRTLPTFRSYEMNTKDDMVRDLLLCSTRLGSYKKEEFIKKYGFNYMEFVSETIKELEQADFLVPDSTDVKLTNKGIVYSDYVGYAIASALKDKLETDNIGFSY